MSRKLFALIVASVMIVGAGGYWLGQHGIGMRTAMQGAMQKNAPTPSGPVVYYRDPDGKPFYSLEPKATSDGRPYRAVLASEDISFDPKVTTADAPGQQSGKRRIIHYRNPMGLPDISPVPKKDSMGMDYIPVYEGDQDDGPAVRVSPGKLQRTGVKTELVGKLPIDQIIKAPGVVTFDETKLSVVAMRFDGFINKVMPVTSGT